MTDVVKRLTAEEIHEFMNEPIQRSAEVKVAHRLGYWGADTDVDSVTTEEIEEADAYLEAHIQWRIAQAQEELALKANRAGTYSVEVYNSEDNEFLKIIEDDSPLRITDDETGDILFQIAVTPED